MAITGNNNVTYKPVINNGERGAPQIVLKRERNGVVAYNTARVVERAVDQFKVVVDTLLSEAKDCEETTKKLPMVETQWK